MSKRPVPASVAAVSALLTPEAVRERCEALWQQAQQDALPHWRLHPDALDSAARYVLAETQRNYPHLKVPFHSRWRHFELAGRDLWHDVWQAQACGDVHATARSRFDLAIVSVLLDAGAGPRWRFHDTDTGLTLGRSEGLALASLRLFAAGTLSRDGRRDPLRADTKTLAALEPDRLAAAMQSRQDNPLLGLTERCRLLNRLGDAVRAQPQWFARDGHTRPGHLYDALRARAHDGVLPAREILIALLQTLGPVWPHGRQIDGVPVGDVGLHPALCRNDATHNLVPFHKLSQWLAYSLMEPLTAAGIRVSNPDALTGLPEYRNGGLLFDLGVLGLRDPNEQTREQDPTGPLVVEWRALTVAALDRIAARVRSLLRTDAGALPLASVLQGGTWSAGRRIAAERRADGGPPLRLASDGTLF